MQNGDTGIQMNERVQVVWDETGQSFGATIKKIHEGGSCDIVYDELVQGQQVLEQNVSPERIIRSMASVNTEEELYWNEEFVPETFKIDALMKPVDIFQDIDDEAKLDHPQVIRIFVNYQSVAGESEKRQALSNSLVEYLQQFDMSENFPIVEEIFNDSMDSAQRLNSWLKDAKASSDSPIIALKGLLFAGIMLIHFSQYEANENPFPEELLEHVIHIAFSFLNSNIVSNPGGSKVKSKAGNAGSSVSAKVLGMQRKCFAEAMCSVLPLFVSFNQALEELLGATRQSDKVAHLVCELSFAQLKMDVSSNVLVEAVECRDSMALRNLHRSTIALQRALFRGYASLRQTVVVESIVLFAQLYTVKNPSKTFALHYCNTSIGDMGKHIPMGLASLMTMLQSCLVGVHSSVTKSMLASGMQQQQGEDMDEDNGGGFNAGGFVKNSLSECAKYCGMFVGELLKRCTNKESSVEYRAVTVQLLTDILASSQSPDWPVVQILVNQFLLRAHHQLQASSAGEGTKRDSSFVNFLIEVVGTLCQGLRRLVMVVEGEQRKSEGFQLAPAVLEMIRKKVSSVQHEWEPDVETVVAAKPKKKEPPPASGKKKGKKAKEEVHVVEPEESLPSSGPRFSCEKALSIMLEVVSFTMDAVAELPGEQVRMASVVPNPLSLLQQLGDQEQLIGQLPSITQCDMRCLTVLKHLQQLVSRYNSKVLVKAEDYGEDCSGAEDALNLSLLLWLQEVHQDRRQEVLTYVLALIKSPAKLDSKSLWAEHLWQGSSSMESVIASTLFMGAERFMRDCFETTLSIVINLFVDPVPAIRAKALKLLSSVLSVDADLIQRDRVREGVTFKIQDRSISVREEAIKLIGSFIISGYQNLSAAYLEALKERIHDEGISVRKSVVNIFKEILLHQPNHPQYLELCLSLLEKLSEPKEEDSIKESIQLTFQQIWFLPPTLSAINTSSALLSSAASAISPLSQLAPSISSMSLSKMNLLDAADSSKEFVLPADWQETTEVDMESGSAGRSVFLGPSGEQLGSLEEVQQYLSSKAAPVAPVPPARNSKNMGKAAASVHIESTTLQIVEVASMPVAYNWMISLLREVLHGKSSGDEVQSQLKQRRTASIKHCERIVQNLVELLLRAEEGDASLMQYVEAQKQKDRKTYILHLILTISLFCEANPPFILKHIHTLLPYLKGDASFTAAQNAQLTLRITKIISAAAVLDASALKVNLSEVIADLNAICLNYGGDNVNAAIHCIALLIANLTHNVQPFFSLLEKCFYSVASIAKSVPNVAQINPAQMAKIQRCMIVLGCICEHAKKCEADLQSIADSIRRYPASSDVSILGGWDAISVTQYYGDKTNDQFAALPLAKVERIHPNNIFGACYSAAIYGLSINNSAVQQRAAQSLCGIFTGMPRLMLQCQQSGVLRELLSSGYSEQVHDRFIASLKDMMMTEEARLEQHEALTLMKESGISLADAAGRKILGHVQMDADVSIAGSVLQQNLQLLLGFLTNKHARLRSTTLELLGTLLRQGMLCSLDVISPLITMQGDIESLSNQQLALKLLQIEDEKHPHFLDNRLLDGMEDTYAFQVKTFGRSVPAMMDPHGVARHSVFQELYQTCVRMQKKRKAEALNGSLRRSNASFNVINEAFAQFPNSAESQSLLQIAAANAAREAASPSAVEHGKTDKSPKPTPTGKYRSSADYRKMNFLQEGLQKLMTTEFLMESLALLPFETLDEPMQLVYFINRNVVLSSSIILSKLKTQLLGVGGELRKEGEMQAPVLGTKPVASSAQQSSSSKSKGLFFVPKHNPDLDIDILINEAAYFQWIKTATNDELWLKLNELYCSAMELRSKEAILRLKAYIKYTYSLTDERCQGYSPDDKTAASERVTVAEVPVQYTPLPESILHYKELMEGELESWYRTPVTIDELKTNQSLRSKSLQLIKVIISDFNRNVMLLNQDPEDFTLSVSATKATTKRKRKNAAADDGSVPGAGLKKAAPRKPKKAKRAAAYDDEDGDSDELMLDSDEDDAGSKSKPKARSKTKPSTPTTPDTSPVSASARSQRSSRVAVSYVEEEFQLSSDEDN